MTQKAAYRRAFAQPAGIVEHPVYCQTSCKGYEGTAAKI